MMAVVRCRKANRRIEELEADPSSKFTDGYSTEELEVRGSALE